MNSSSIITDYAKSSKHICLCSTISICLILIFIFSPINNLIMTSVIGKIIVLILLGYTLVYNIRLTNNFSNKITPYLDNTSNSGSIKTNIICSYIFSVFVVMLIISVIRSLFRF